MLVVVSQKIQEPLETPNPQYRYRGIVIQKRINRTSPLPSITPSGTVEGTDY
jgi:hypothetical protein